MESANPPRGVPRIEESTIQKTDERSAVIRIFQTEKVLRPFAQMESEL